MAIEETRGLLKSNLYLDSPRGQDGIRLLLMRSIEELLEVLTADLQLHQQEEVIDSINYLLSLLCLDQDAFPRAAELFSKRVLERWPAVKFNVFSKDSLGDVLIRVLYPASSVLELLRNRSWQYHAQSCYFDGLVDLSWYVADTFLNLLGFFTDWWEFLSFYIAKDRVLQFRLRSRY